MKKFVLRIWWYLEGLVVKRPCAVLIAGLAVVVLSVFAAGSIEMKTKIQDMLPADNPQVLSYTEIDELFNGGSTVLLTISGTGRENILNAAEALVEAVRSNPSLTALSRSIYFGLNEDFVDKWALVLQDADDLERTAELYEKTDLLHYFSALNRSVEEAWTGDEPDQDLENFRQEAEAVAWLNQLDRGMTLISEALEDPNPSSYGAELAQVMSVGDLNGFNDEGTMLMVTIVPDFNMVDFEKIELMMKEVRVLLDRMREQFPDLSFAYTGDVPIQSDEQAALGFDMLIPTLVAVFLILVLFIASFQRIATIFYLLFSLIAGVVITYGFLGITIREVNMLTSVFGVLLVGLGVDYGIQVASNYRGYRMQGMDIARAMSTTYRRAGTGVVLAALTTSVAFFVLAGTGTMAFRQFGFVLGSGISDLPLCHDLDPPRFSGSLGSKAAASPGKESGSTEERQRHSSGRTQECETRQTSSGIRIPDVHSRVLPTSSAISAGPYGDLDCCPWCDGGDDAQDGLRPDVYGAPGHALHCGLSRRDGVLWHHPVPFDGGGRRLGRRPCPYRCPRIGNPDRRSGFRGRPRPAERRAVGGSGNHPKDSGRQSTI
jgi:hypothetical protein